MFIWTIDPELVINSDFVENFFIAKERTDKFPVPTVSLIARMAPGCRMDVITIKSVNEEQRAELVTFMRNLVEQINGVDPVQDQRITRRPFRKLMQ